MLLIDIIHSIRQRLRSNHKVIELQFLSVLGKVEYVIGEVLGGLRSLSCNMDFVFYLHLLVRRFGVYVKVCFCLVLPYSRIGYLPKRANKIVLDDA